MNQEKDSTWYTDWFNSPWYHKLYKHRDAAEAEHFIRLISQKLGIPLGARVLDLACGKGRHAIALSKFGFNVTGIDISEESITEAKKSENGSLHFFVYDMRKNFREDYFDVIFNLFTSFGYFVRDEDNGAVIKAVYNDLKQGGLFILDIFNSEKVKKAVAENPDGTINEGTIRIAWSKKIFNNMVMKEIVVNENGKNQYFSEMVKLYTEKDIRAFLGNEFEVKYTFGDYSLNEFDVNTSDRLIIVAQKK
ncbi:MAG TPA: class I SAM-dependent methyltransferase [Bacteroidia bacterium]|nr:class I SAM-dependent methyltransferase [Bacteroidia bacterium]